MSYSAIDACYSKNVPIYFYQVKGSETPEDIATKLDVNLNQISWDKGDSQPQAGDIVVVNLR
jgi:hypothetical protein